MNLTDRQVDRYAAFPCCHQQHGRKRTSSFAAAVVAAAPPPSFRNPKIAMGLTGAALLVPALASKSCWPAGLAERLARIRHHALHLCRGAGAACRRRL